LALLTTGDSGEVTELLAESADFHRGWVSYPTRPGPVKSFLADAATNGFMVFGVRCLADQSLAGIATLCRFAGEPWATAEYGCAVGVQYRGHGYLTEATVLLTRSAFTELGLHPSRTKIGSAW
jgi:RimJ/RimL family protein N-acetyltransferase